MRFRIRAGASTAKIDIGSRDGEATLKLHAWLLPKPPGAAEQFAIAWNGLIYPVLKVGGAADARADMDALIEADRKFLDDAFKKNAKEQAESAETRRRHGDKDATPNWPNLRQRTWPETDRIDVAQDTMSDFKAVFCLRLGMGAQARKIWAQ